MQLQSSSSTSAHLGNQVFLAQCQASDAVGDAVYVAGPASGTRFTVSKVDIDDAGKMPAIGVIIQKSSDTECVVQFQGIVRNIYEAMIPQKPLFIGTDSRPSYNIPPRPLSGRRFVQHIAHALSETTVLISVRNPLILTT